MGSNCSINPNTAFYFVNRIKPGLTFAPLVPPQNDWKSTHRWISARWSPWLLALATNLSETHSKSKAPWKWMVGIFDPFPFWENPMFRGELFLFLGRVTKSKWWCYFLASQAGGEKGKAQSRHPKNDVFVQNIPPKQHPRSDWNSLDSNGFCLLRILVILFVYCNRFIERSRYRSINNNHGNDYLSIRSEETRKNQSIHIKKKFWPSTFTIT